MTQLSENRPIRDVPSPNCGPRPAGVAVDTVVLHYTGMRSAEDALVRLRDPAAAVSAHYLIDEDGAITRLVPEEMRAWHAGIASWKGETNINDRSIGIELVNPGHEFGYRPFPAAQMEALVALLRGVLARHSIPASRILAHSDVAPMRKQDPGELFDWPLLARSGIGAFPERSMAAGPHSPLNPAGAQALLAAIGYAAPPSGSFDDETAAALAAFQRRFRPERVDGRLDAETAALLRRVAAQSTA